MGVVRENGSEQTPLPPVVREFHVSTLTTCFLIITHLKEIPLSLGIPFVPQHTPLSYDYVLVAKTNDNLDREAFKKQMEYIDELKKKKLKVTVSVLKGQICGSVP